MNSIRHHRAHSGTTLLTGIELNNFKSVRHCNVPLEPLTVVTGANSSGKSSLLQAVLALTQVSNRRINGARFPLNDDLVRLGTFANLRHQRASSDEPVGIACRFSSILRDLSRFVTSSGEFLDLESRRSKEQIPVTVRWAIEMDSAVRGQVGSARISTINSRIVGKDLEISAWVERTAKRSVVDETLPDRHVRRLSYRGTVSSGSSTTEIVDARVVSGRIRVMFGEPPELRRASSLVRDWLGRVSHQSKTDAPSPDADIWDSGLDSVRGFVELAAHSSRFDLPAPSKFVEWFATLDNGIREELVSQTIDTLEHNIELANISGWESLSISPIVSRMQQLCASYLSMHVRYVGPLRHPPHGPFVAAPDPDSGDVGVSGEHVASVLQARRSRVRRYPLPADEYGSDDVGESSTLEEAVVNWLHYLKLADSMTVIETTPLVLSISVRPPGLEDPVPLGSVGVGVSQVLPVIVQCLVAGPGALVILEQPELHLHPAAQQRLADFLIACTRWGQRFLIESHSEHLVLRLRRRIAEDRSDSLKDDVAILFAERDDDGNTAYRQVEVTETGGVPDWPKGFFDQAPDDAHGLLVAATSRQSPPD